MNGTPSRSSAWLSFAQRSRDEGGLGLAPHQAAGLVGNLVHESGQDLSPWGPTGDNGTAWGTAQWRGDRLARLQARPDHQTMEGQQAFMREEFDGPEAKAYKALLAAKTPEEAATAVNTLYERSADRSGNRERAARDLMAQFGGAATSPGALTMAYASEDKPALAQAPGALYAPQAEPDYMNTIGQGLTGIGSALAGISSPSQAQALNQQAALMKKAGADGSWSSHVAPNGQMYKINGKTGQIIPVAGNYAAPKDDEYNKEYDKKAAERWVKTDQDITDHSDKATGMLGDLQQVKAALANPNLTQGQFGELMQKGRSMLSYFDPELAKTAADGDVVNALTHKMALQLVKADKLLPGSFSDSDRQFVTGLTPSLANTPEANQRLIAIIEKSSQRAQETEAARVAYTAAHNGRLDNGFRTVQNDLQKKWQAEDAEAAKLQKQPAAAQPKSFKTQTGVNWSF